MSKELTAEAESIVLKFIDIVAKSSGVEGHDAVHTVLSTLRSLPEISEAIKEAEGEVITPAV